LNKFISRLVTFLLICTLPYLKMVGVIDWSWWVTFLPAFSIVLIFVLLIFFATIEIKRNDYNQIIIQKENTIRRLERDNQTLTYLVKKLRKANKRK